MTHILILLYFSLYSVIGLGIGYETTRHRHTMTHHTHLKNGALVLFSLTISGLGFYSFLHS